MYISKCCLRFISFLSYISLLSEQLPIFLLSTAYYHYKLQVFIFCKKSWIFHKKQRYFIKSRRLRTQKVFFFYLFIFHLWESLWVYVHGRWEILWTKNCMPFVACALISYCLQRYSCSIKITRAHCKFVWFAYCPIECRSSAVCSYLIVCVECLVLVDE